MSFCRFSDHSDLYVWYDVSGYYNCWGYKGEVMLDTPQKMLNHMLEARRSGLKVPQYAIDEMRKEISSCEEQ